MDTADTDTMDISPSMDISLSIDSSQSIDIAQAARLSGVSSRTLRHYGDIGLLEPAWTAENGRRYYGQAELLRLQHILVLRELGTDLSRIASIIDATDLETVIAQLQDHLAALVDERDRIARLATTVTRTIDALQKGKAMTTEDIFDGFAHQRYEPEARERWGDAAVDRSNANWASLDEAGKRAHMRMHEEIVEALGAAIRVDYTADSDEVQKIADRHYAWITMFWTPNAEQYRALTQMYVDDERFRMNYDEIAPGAAALLRDAAALYAERELD